MPEDGGALEEALRGGLRRLSAEYMPAQPAQLEAISARVGRAQRSQRRLSMAGIGLAILVAVGALAVPGTPLTVTRVNISTPAASAGGTVIGQSHRHLIPVTGKGGAPVRNRPVPSSSSPPGSASNRQISTGPDSTGPDSTGGSSSTSSSSPDRSSIGRDKAPTPTASGTSVETPSLVPDLPLAAVVTVTAGMRDLVVHVQPGQLVEFDFVGSSTARWGTPVLSGLNAAVRLISGIAEPSGNANAVVLGLLPGVGVVENTQSYSCSSSCPGTGGVPFYASVEVS